MIKLIVTLEFETKFETLTEAKEYENQLIGNKDLRGIFDWINVDDNGKIDFTELETGLIKAKIKYEKIRT